MIDQRSHNENDVIDQHQGTKADSFIGTKGSVTSIIHLTCMKVARLSIRKFSLENLPPLLILIAAHMRCTLFLITYLSYLRQSYSPVKRADMAEDQISFSYLKLANV